MHQSRTIVVAIGLLALLGGSAAAKPKAQGVATVEEATPPLSGTYRLQSNRGCVRISPAGYLHVRAVACSGVDPIFSVIRDTENTFTVRGKVVEGQSYCSTAGKDVPVGAPRVDYMACAVVDIMPVGEGKKPSILTQQFRIAEIRTKPGWFQIASDAFPAPKCWDVSNPEMWTVDLRSCANVAAQQFRLLPATR